MNNAVLEAAVVDASAILSIFEGRALPAPSATRSFSLSCRATFHRIG